MILHALGPFCTILLLVQAGCALGELGPCQVDCRHYGSTLGDLADDPFHCDMYYVCFSVDEWSSLSFKCPDGQMFDTNTKKCMSEGYTCAEPCQKCSYSCSNAIMGQASNFTSCDTYLQCGTGDGTLAFCPSEAPYFDGSICQNDASKCCSCRPECSETDAENHVMLPDYLNCTNYYLCLSPGIPDTSSHGHCPDGNFDSVTSSCSSVAGCDIACVNKLPDDSCVNNLICEVEGYFPRCSESCDPSYYWCPVAGVGLPGQKLVCSNDFVVDPISMLCIPSEECPF